MSSSSSGDSSSSDSSSSSFDNKGCPHTIVNYREHEMVKHKRSKESGIDTCSTKRIRYTLRLERQVTPWLLGDGKQKLYVRKSVESIINEIWSDYEDSKDLLHKRVYFVTGSPGIGKSWSVNLMAGLLMEKRQSFWFHSASKKKLYICEFPEGNGAPAQKMYPESHLENNKPNPDTNPDTWFLFAANRRELSTPFTDMERGIPCVIFSSPNPSNYEDGLRIMYQEGAFLYSQCRYMPVWEWDELSEIICDEYAVNEFEKCGISLEQFKEFYEAMYHIWGGVPGRINLYCLQLKQRTIEEVINEALEDLDREMSDVAQNLVHKRNLREATISVRSVHAMGEASAAAPSWLLHAVPKKDDCEDYSVRFCSLKAELKFAEHVGRDADEITTSKFCGQIISKQGWNLKFEKLARFLVTTKAKRFRLQVDQSYMTAGCPKCELVECDMAHGLEQFKEEIMKCIGNGQDAAIELKNTRQDAIDLFVVLKEGRVYAMRDTINRTNTFLPIKILEYENAAKNALQTALKQEPSDDCFTHIVIAGNNKKLQLGPPTMTDSDSFGVMKKKFNSMGLAFPVEVEEKIKGLLLDIAAREVSSITWKLDYIFS